MEVQLQFVNREGEPDPEFERRLKTRKYRAAVTSRVDALESRLHRAGRIITGNMKRTVLLAYTDATEGTTLLHDYAEAAKQRRIQAVAHKYGLHA